MDTSFRIIENAFSTYGRDSFYGLKGVLMNSNLSSWALVVRKWDPSRRMNEPARTIVVDEIPLSSDFQITNNTMVKEVMARILNFVHPYAIADTAVGYSTNNGEWEVSAGISNDYSGVVMDWLEEAECDGGGC